MSSEPRFIEMAYRGNPAISDPPSHAPTDQVQPEAPFPAQAQATPDRRTTDGVDLDFVLRVIAHRDCVEDIKASAVWNSGNGLFHDWEEKVSGALNAAYPTYLHLLSGGKPAMDEVLSRPDFPERKRRPKKGTEALIALKLVAKPRNENQRKLCSEHAPALIWAAMQGIDPD